MASLSIQRLQALIDGETTLLRELDYDTLVRGEEEVDNVYEISSDLFYLGGHDPYSGFHDEEACCWLDIDIDTERSDSQRVEAALYMLQYHIGKYEEELKDIISETIYFRLPVVVGSGTAVLRYSIYYQNHGMGIEMEEPELIEVVWNGNRYTVGAPRPEKDNPVTLDELTLQDCPPLLKCLILKAWRRNKA